ncbi:MAG: helix-turn-helix transcriptional regulator [Lachnospiraceae bacterium]|nr:helix-turn-helix transcriptional regulator [Lachnospiraceae bacterium]
MNQNSFFLSDLRKERNLTQQKLADELNLSTSAIALYESGKRTPPLKRAVEIAEYFNLPVERISFSNKK